LLISGEAIGSAVPALPHKSGEAKEAKVWADLIRNATMLILAMCFETTKGSTKKKTRAFGGVLDDIR
jgi:hypothetical protein